MAARPKRRLDALLRSTLTQATLADRASQVDLDELSRLLAPTTIETTSVEPTTQDRVPQMLIAPVAVSGLITDLVDLQRDQAPRHHRE